MAIFNMDYIEESNKQGEKVKAAAKAFNDKVFDTTKKSIKYTQQNVKKAVEKIKNPKKEYIEENDILDNMLESCYNMLDALDEGNAFNKYSAKLAKEYADNKKKAEQYGELNNMYAKRFGTYKMDYSDKARDAKEKSMKAYKEYEKANPEVSSVTCDYPDVSEKYKKSKGCKYDTYSHERNDKREWMEKHGNKGTDILAEREPNSVKKIQDKKKAIKETCEYILSIIDDIE